MKKFIFVLTLAMASISSAADPKPAATPIKHDGLPPGVMTTAEEAETLLNEGDAIYSVRTENTKNASDAIEAYEKALQKDSSQADALWKAARAAHWAGDHAETPKEKIAWYEKGIDFAKRGILLKPSSVESHFWLGANYGSYGEYKGVLKSLSLVKPIRREMESVVRLDNRYQGGGGYRVLGVVDYKVPGFAGGSKKRALENLMKAVEIDPANAFNQYYLAEYYDVVDDRYKAFTHLDELDKLTPTSDVDAADLKFVQQKGKKLRKKLGK